jgi:hypothetical protein
MDMTYRASAHDNPLGDRKDTPDHWSPRRVEEVSNREVKQPDGEDIDVPQPDEDDGASDRTDDKRT